MLEDIFAQFSDEIRPTQAAYSPMRSPLCDSLLIRDCSVERLLPRVVGNRANLPPQPTIHVTVYCHTSMFLSTTAQAKELALCFRYRAKLPFPVQRFLLSPVSAAECYVVTGPLIRRPATQVSNAQRMRTFMFVFQTLLFRSRVFCSVRPCRV